MSTCAGRPITPLPAPCSPERAPVAPEEEPRRSRRRSWALRSRSPGVRGQKRRCARITPDARTNAQTNMPSVPAGRPDTIMNTPPPRRPAPTPRPMSTRSPWPRRTINVSASQPALRPARIHIRLILTICSFIVPSTDRSARYVAPGELDGRPDDLHQSDRGKAADHHPRWIELEPSHAELRRPRMRVMVVVQTLAGRQPGEGSRIIRGVAEVLPPSPVPEAVDQRREHEDIQHRVHQPGRETDLDSEHHAQQPDPYREPAHPP